MARFDLDMFYPEAHRILKPGGCLAAWGYDMLTFPDKHDAQDLLHRFSTVILAPYWNEKVKHVWHHYKGMKLFKVPCVSSLAPYVKEKLNPDSTFPAQILNQMQHCSKSGTCN